MKERMIQSRLKFKISELSPRQYNHLSPVSLKLGKSSDNLLKYNSPSLKTKKDISEKIINIWTSTNVIEKLKHSFEVLKLCSTQESIFSAEMRAIIDTIQFGLFINKTNIDKEVLQHMYDNYTESIIEDSSLPYFYAMDCNKKILEKTRKEFQESLEEKIKQEKRLKEIIEEKHKKVIELEAFIQENITKPIESRDKEIAISQAKLAQSLAIIKTHEQTIEDNEEVIRQIRMQNSSHKRRIISLQNLDDEKSLKIKDLENSIDDMKKNIKFHTDECNKMKYYIDHSISTIKTLSEREKELENRISDLETKNRALSVRAAGGFESLTPRPSFNRVMEILPTGTLSTEEKTQKLINILLATKEALNKKPSKPWKKSVKLPHKSIILPTDFTISKLYDP
ncbi:hypothetical protein SteCoe_9883 [Stentor coeruleus]|uniref:Uncharacterized protein n=1 Tax=Stentor coeruleus TaxID=5963 RepID=A0A1R2CGU2_9CILI|nr:hypothetical protein SteCoe_9883 [Stentor coeruleus]